MNNFWKNKRVLITGITGLLGSWLTKHLLENEAGIIGLIRDEVPDSNLNRAGLLKDIVQVRGDVQDYTLLERTLNEYEVDVVFHLAAQTIVNVANRNPISTFESNIKGTWNILEACRNTKTAKQIVVASSDKAYGDTDNLPYKEDYPLRASHPYDVSKACADLIAQSYYKTYNLPVCITRCGNLYGGGDLNFSRIIPDTIRSIFWNRSPLIRSDGKFIRDYFYVEDAVFAMLALVEKMQEKDIYGEAFNFASGVHISVLDLVNKILKLMNKKLKPKILNEAKHEIKDQYLSINKAKKRLSWQPKYTLDAGLKKTIAWYENYLREK